MFVNRRNVRLLEEEETLIVDIDWINLQLTFGLESSSKIPYKFAHVAPLPPNESVFMPLNYTKAPVMTGLLIAKVNVKTMCELGSGGVSLVISINEDIRVGGGMNTIVIESQILIGFRLDSRFGCAGISFLITGKDTYINPDGVSSIRDSVKACKQKIDWGFVEIWIWTHKEEHQPNKAEANQKRNTKELQKEGDLRRKVQ
ncbi:hypothetical protein Tco_0073089 [Tanacetum coccineum]